MKFSILLFTLSFLFAGLAPAQNIRLKKVAPKKGLQTEFSTKAAKRRDSRTTLDQRPRHNQREASRLERLAAMPDRKAEPLPEFEHNFDRETPAHARLYDAPAVQATRPRAKIATNSPAPSVRLKRDRVSTRKSTVARLSPRQRSALRSRELQRQQALAAYPADYDDAKFPQESAQAPVMTKTSRGTPVTVSPTAYNRHDDVVAESRTAYPQQASKVLEPKTDSDLFYAHGTESARTLRPLQMSYSRVAGTDPIEGMFIMNSVNIGVTDYLQVGVNPLLYAISNTYNFSAKLNFYNTDNLSFALGYSHLTVHSDIFGGITIHNNGLSVISNYFIDERWSASYLVQASHTYGAMDGFEYEKVSQPSHYADVQYRINSNWISTSGLSYTPGRAKDNPTYNLDRMMMGVGSSMTWKMPKSWFFMYPAAGIHYYPEINDQTFLFSVYFQ